MKVIYKAAALALAASFLPNGVGAAKLYKCVSESGETTYKQIPCTNAKQQKVLEHKTRADRKHDAEARGKDAHEAKLPENQKDRDTYMAEIRKRLDAHGDEAQKRLKSSPEQAIEGGYAVAGMSKSEVRTAMGEPSSVMGPDYSTGAASETWTYEVAGKTEFVFFSSGKVTSMSAHLQ